MTNSMRLRVTVAQRLIRGNKAYDGLCASFPGVREFVDGLPSVGPLKSFPAELTMVFVDILNLAGIDPTTGEEVFS